MLALSPPSTTASLVDDATCTTSSRKTRDSCDACAKSKVRCGKQHPRCDRCVARNQTCNYGLIRPKGRPRLSQRSPSTPAGGSQPCSPDPCLDLNIFSTLYNPESIADIYLDCPPESAITPTSNLISRYIQHQDDWQSLNHELTLPFDMTTPQTTVTLRPEQSDCRMDSILTTASPLPHSSPAPHPGPGNSCRELQPCTGLILETIRSLLLPLDTCARHMTAPRSASLDTILRVNNDAIDNLDVVLRCTCSMEPFFATLVAQVITKILRWYDQIIEDCECLDWEMGDTLIEFEPIKIGGFEPSKSDSRRMLLQMVMIELDRVQTLMGRFVNRYCRPDVLFYEEESPVNLALEAALRQRLNAARSHAVLTMAG
ncbi:hypothetical protein AbraIFM66951_002744 [Aspergillus brasiliensis]|uniref:Zn(2)-C6 fungal-type domain-containing protein n=1 Tax=Aspergillus brasiliensis TaxID=319629 RepID=A0A9W6DR48_9EURO|nr:hypothetical protein AbraCBS73388_002783 [Aspergillus brasiliensis]GKZ42811.1 hypothetical protein AbraIFM66951_002744 [Aspergillus brasiliensis]